MSADTATFTNHAQLVCDSIDKIDGSPFGKVGKLLDSIADRAALALNERQRLLIALDGVVLVCGRTGNTLEDFEEQAAAFQQETGFMRPGKDMPMEGSGNDDPEERRGKYVAWVKSKIEAGRIALKQSQAD